MNLILLQYQKYLRRLGWFWLPWSIVLILHTLLGAQFADPSTPLDEVVPYLLIIPPLLWAMIFFGVSLVVHEDSLLDPSALWQSRPVREPKLLASKALAVGTAFLALPALSIWLALLTEFSVQTAVFVAAWKAALLAGPVVLLFAVASVTRDSRRYIQGILLVFAGLIGCAYLLKNVSPGWLANLGGRIDSIAEKEPVFAPEIGRAFFLVSTSWVLGCSALAILVQHLYRKTALAIVIAIAAWLTWLPAIRIGKEIADLRWFRSLPPTASQPQGTTLHWPSLTGPTRNGRPRPSTHVLYAQFPLDEKFSGFDVSAALLEGEALVAGQTFTATQPLNSRAWADERLNPDVLVRALEGAALLNAPPVNRPEVGLLHLHNTDLSALEARHGTYNGVVGFYLYAYQKTAEADLALGTTLAHDGLSFEVTEITTDDVIKLNLRTAYQISPFFGSSGRRRIPGNENPLYSLVLWNPLQHQVCPAFSRSDLNPRPQSPFEKVVLRWFGIQRKSLSFEFKRTEEMTDAWLEEAKLVLIEKELVERVTRRFELAFEIPEQEAAPVGTPSGDVQPLSKRMKAVRDAIHERRRLRAERSSQ